MEARNQIAEDSELRDEEDLNVSNLLVTKSERAPTTESDQSLRGQRSASAVIKTAVLGALASVAAAAVIMLARRLLSEPHRSAASEIKNNPPKTRNLNTESRNKS